MNYDAKAFTRNPVEILPEAAFHCPIHGQYRGKAVKLLFLGGEKEMTISPHCQKCKEKTDAEKAQKDEESRKQLAIQR